MSLDVDLAFDRPGFQLRAAFSAQRGVTALFGPSGSGKTTISLLIAGLLRAGRGRIVLDDVALFDSERRIRVPAHRRRVAAVFQDTRLFPHLSVRQNLAFGRWFHPRSRFKPEPIAELLGIAGLLGRRPPSLSGGEQRRVAIGRALVADPRLLILDEPLTGLDAPRKLEILRYLEQLRDETGVPMVLVTHGLDEVVRLADTLVLVEHGRTPASGPLAEIMPQLIDRMDAGSVIEARVLATSSEEGVARVGFPGGELMVPSSALAVGDRLRILVRAREVALATEPPHGISIRNVLRATVSSMREVKNGAVDVALDLSGTGLVSRITAGSAKALALGPGVPVYALVKSVSFDRQSAEIS